MNIVIADFTEAERAQLSFLINGIYQHLSSQSEGVEELLTNLVHHQGWPDQGFNQKQAEALTVQLNNEVLAAIKQNLNIKEQDLTPLLNTLAQKLTQKISYFNQIFDVCLYLIDEKGSLEDARNKAQELMKENQNNIDMSKLLPAFDFVFEIMSENMRVSKVSRLEYIFRVITNECLQAHPGSQGSEPGGKRSRRF